MNVDEYLRTVTGRAGLESEEAVRAATTATLRTLGQRISPGQAEDLADDLPEAFAEALLRDVGDDAASFSPAEFVDRVRAYEHEETSLDASDADRHVGAVLAGLDESVDTHVWGETRSQLAAEFGKLTDHPTRTDPEAYD
ncbi:DUF2267 domain-containing protein [Haloarchaeobius sp. DFWS5]|uniref:DUF2267 domain-containing protein n=1 Tax=Haloarchaeobius sp. DFWS5 TaxID=3446114 RepID=UPI003EB78C3C